MFHFERFEPLLEVNRLVDFVGKCVYLERCKAWFDQVKSNYITLNPSQVHVYNVKTELNSGSNLREHRGLSNIVDYRVVHFSRIFYS